LAFGDLDLTPQVAGLSQAIVGGAWRGIGIDTDWLGNLAGDIRLSTDSLSLGGISFKETAASLTLHDRRLEIAIAEAAIGGGIVAGDLTLADENEPGSFSTTAQMRAEGVNIAETGLDPAGEISGTADIEVDVAGKGTSLGSLMASLSGTMRITVIDGALPLPDLDAIMISGADGLAPSGLAEVNSLDANLAIADGHAVLEEAVLVTPSVGAEARGTIRLADFGIDIEGSIRRADDIANAATFAVGGTLAAPSFHVVPATE
jgi:AsmA protein